MALGGHLFGGLVEVAIVFGAHDQVALGVFQVGQFPHKPTGVVCHLVNVNFARLGDRCAVGAELRRHCSRRGSCLCCHTPFLVDTFFLVFAGILSSAGSRMSRSGLHGANHC